MNTKVLTIFIDEFKSNRPCFTFKAFKPIFLTFLMYFWNSLFYYLWFNFFVCYGDIRGNHFALNLHKFGFAYSEELEVNQWIALDILSSQSECVKNTYYIILVLNLFMFYCRWGQTMRDWWHLKVTPAARRNRKIVHWNSSPQQGGNREVKKKLQCSVWVAMLNSHKYAIMKKQIMKSTLCTWGVCL